MRAIVLGDHQEAARVLVEPVHDARPPHAADARQAVAAMGDERVDERAARMPRRRMHDEPGRLVDHDEVVVLVDDRERDRLRLRLGRRGRRHDERDARARARLERRIAHNGSSTVTRPSRISACRRLRDRSGKARARTRSSRSGAPSSATTSSRRSPPAGATVASGAEAAAGAGAASAARPASGAARFDELICCGGR